MKTARLDRLEVNATDIARMLRILANEQRVRIVCRLAASHEELPIAALGAGLKISQSALSQHLMKLRKGGLIASRRTGRNLLYRLNDTRAAQFANALPKIFGQAS